MDLDKSKILVFDSGIGGLGVAKSLYSTAPEVSLSYLADNAFFPYGEKEDDVLLERIIKLITTAAKQLSPDVIVLACNTASTLSLAPLRKIISDIPIVGCVPPIKMAADLSKTKHIGLLATKATGRRPYLKELVQEYAQDCELFSHVGKNLAELAERYMSGQTVQKAEIETELAKLFSEDAENTVDTVALGCTHYSFLMPFFESIRPDIQWCDPQPAVAKRALHLLTDVKAKAVNIPKEPNTFFVTADNNNFPSEFLKEYLDKIGFKKFKKLKD